MAIYSLGTVTGQGGTPFPIWEIRTASTDRAVLLESFFNLAAVAASSFRFGWGRPGAIGVTPTSPITFIAEEPSDPVGTVTSAIAWGTDPTVPANFFRRTTLFGPTYVHWAFDDGITIPVSSSLVLWLISGASSTMEAFAKVNE
jgi:hypothetical protein